MKSIIKTLFIFLMLHTAISTCYSQDKKSSEVLQSPGTYQESVVMRPGKSKQAGNDQGVAEAKKNAEGVKILILGDNYKPADELWLQLGSLNFKEQSDLLKEILFKNADVRKLVINDASREVYGNGAEAADFAYWDAKIIKEKKDGYATIVSANIASLNADKNKRELVIRVAYVTVFGREATTAELGKWMSSTAHYRIIYQSLIAYMYSIEGANDLTATVKKTFSRNNQTYTDDQLIQRMMAAKAQKMDFLKMVNSF